MDKLIKAGPGLVIRVAVTPHELPEVLLPHGAAPSASRGVVMDIETCGLRSMPIFLAGFLDVAHGRISQLLACHYAAEPELLRHVAEIVERADALVTYNGAAFDLPFLMDRMRYWRLGELKLPAHADLLGLLRRQVEAWLPNLRLATVEAELLGRVRIHDVAGSDIPQIYARFVEAQDMRVIAPVLAHNLVDMLSCWALARLLDV
ncbi:MAG: ribonuclease H-like domain-containing protein [Armatimonadetes bacterium]|nr:ribonuclease H-like domain-containing protein [Armatimonadota bacterium]